MTPAITSVRSRLIFYLTLLVAAISLLIFFSIPARVKTRALAALADKASSLTEMTAYSVAPALLFEDAAGVTEVLESIRQDEDVIYAVLLDKDGEWFAAVNQDSAVFYNFRDLPGSGISIGRECVIGLGAIITGQGKVTLGDKVIVGPRAMILPVNHRYQDPGAAIKDQGIEAKGIAIADGAWIGAGAMILDGVTLGQNAVVAAGAVVAENVPARTLVAGNPAKKIKEWNES